MYDFDLNNLDNIELIVDTIKEYGVCRIPNYLNIEIVDKLKNECQPLLERETDDGYSFGTATRLNNNSYVGTHDAITSVFKNEKLFEICKQYMGKEPNLNNDVFITHDHISDKGLARNGYLHFDRIYTFKFFIYLTDVDDDCGPFSIIPKTHIKGKELRLKTTGNNYESKKNRIFLDYPELGYAESDIIPIIGEAGDMMIFDTDLFHMGGVTKNNKERLIIRGHTR
jgi:ectoine hydroxylase-related dioxygenase (phytanoyl-CoA dioxygenase family)